MYYYEISWSWNDEYIPIILTNDRAFSDEKFKNIVDNAVSLAFGKLFDDEYKKGSEERLQIGFCRWGELSKMILDHIKDYGFEELKIRSHIDYFGMYIVDRSLPKEEYDRLKNMCGEILVNKMIDHNDKVEGQLFGGLDKQLSDELDDQN